MRLAWQSGCKVEGLRGNIGQGHLRCRYSAEGNDVVLDGNRVFQQQDIGAVIEIQEDVERRGVR